MMQKLVRSQVKNLRYSRSFFTVLCYANTVYPMALCPTICHKPVLYQNG